MGILALFLTIIGLFPSWLGEACSNLRSQIIILLLIAMLPPLFATPRWLLLYVLLVPCLVTNIFFVVPVMFPQEKPKDSHSLSELRFKILELVVEDGEKSVEKTLSLVKEEKPEVVCIQRVTKRWLEQCQKPFADLGYKNSALFPRDDQYGMAIFSTRSLGGTAQRGIGNAKIPIVSTSVRFDFGPVRVISVRLPDSFAIGSFEERAVVLDAVAQMVSSSKERTIVVGNFNVTPYSVAFDSFLNKSGLTDSRAGAGVHPNCYLPEVEGFDFYLNRFSMDHIFFNERLATFTRRVASSGIGSTHRPIICELYPSSSVDGSGEATEPTDSE